jgi:hypothetical protein
MIRHHEDSIATGGSRCSSERIRLGDRDPAPPERCLIHLIVVLDGLAVNVQTAAAEAAGPPVRLVGVAGQIHLVGTCDHPVAC